MPEKRKKKDEPFKAPEGSRLQGEPLDIGQERLAASTENRIRREEWAFKVDPGAVTRWLKRRRDERRERERARQPRTPS